MLGHVLGGVLSTVTGLPLAMMPQQVRHRRMQSACLRLPGRHNSPRPPAAVPQPVANSGAVTAIMRRNRHQMITAEE